ncbi:MAG TPA: hypothetical protein VEH27_08185 [Methylomirabilota bacterium]|nr:hypothetical protein [Methylomirabilota bacterium]
MKLYRIHALFIALIVASAHAATFKSGVAVRVVTPEPLLPVSGGVGASNPVREKKGDLTVRALALEENGNRVVFVGTDFLGFPGPLCDRVRAKVKDVPAENILIGATHTHSAPDCYGFVEKPEQFAENLKYLDIVVAKAAEAINEAVANLTEGSFSVASGPAKGKIAYNYYAEQLYDPRCNVIQTFDSQGKVIATLVNYAIHPEVLGNDVGILSPDLCGPLYDRIAERGGGTAVFMNGAQGGMITADNRAGPGQKDLRTWEECLRIGRLLADEALRIAASAPKQTEAKLHVAARTVTFPVESPLLLHVLKTSPLRYPTDNQSSITSRLNLVNIGNAQIVTIPGEALPNIGYYLKRKMRGEHNFLFGLTNDAFGYILTKEDFNSFERYSYVTRTSLGEQTHDILQEALLEMIAQAPAARQN